MRPSNSPSANPPRPYGVTAIIAVYNGATAIARAVESVLAQTRPVDELIVVDDGSTDNTAEIVRGFGEKVRLVSQANAGVAAARNRGAREANSEWLALLDHDDEWLPRKLEVQMAALERQPAARFCYSGYWLHRIDGTTVQRHLPADAFWPEARLRNPAPPSCVIFHRDTFFQVGGFDERLKGASCEDWDLIVRFAAASPPLGVAEPLMRYHETAGGNSRKYRRMLANELMITESLTAGLSGLKRVAWRRRIKGGMYYRASLSAADLGEPSCGYLLRSLWLWPFPDEYRRYKRLAAVAARGALDLVAADKPRKSPSQTN